MHICIYAYAHTQNYTSILPRFCVQSFTYIYQICVCVYVHMCMHIHITYTLSRKYKEYIHAIHNMHICKHACVQTCIDIHTASCHVCALSIHISGVWRTNLESMPRFRATCVHSCVYIYIYIYMYIYIYIHTYAHTYM